MPLSQLSPLPIGPHLCVCVHLRVQQKQCQRGRRRPRHVVVGPCHSIDLGLAFRHVDGVGRFVVAIGSGPHRGIVCVSVGPCLFRLSLGDAGLGRQWLFVSLWPTWTVPTGPTVVVAVRGVGVSLQRCDGVFGTIVFVHFRVLVFHFIKHVALDFHGPLERTRRICPRRGVDQCRVAASHHAP